MSTELSSDGDVWVVAEVLIKHWLGALYQTLLNLIPTAVAEPESERGAGRLLFASSDAEAFSHLPFTNFFKGHEGFSDSN